MTLCLMNELYLNTGITKTCTIVKQKLKQDYMLCSLPKQFSTGVLQEFLKHAISDYLVKGTDLFFFRLSNKKMTTANTTIAVWCE